MLGNVQECWRMLGKDEDCLEMFRYDNGRIVFLKKEDRDGR